MYKVALSGMLLFFGFPLFAFASSQTFTSNTSFVVPSGVSTMTAQLWGGGGYAGGQYSYVDGGAGGYITGTFNVTPGSTLYLYVGDNGGFGGGGSPGGGCAALSFSPSLTNSFIVAAGGGGGPGYEVIAGTGAGGGYTGGSGGGGGGTQTSGGSAGGGGYPGYPPAYGTFFQGGTGQQDTGHGGGGGGGCGYYGGGGGGDSSGGGGGSSWANSSIVWGVSTTLGGGDPGGVYSDNGSSYPGGGHIVLSWTATTAPPPPASMTATCSANGTQATLSWSSVSGATGYYPRINSNAYPSAGTCPSNMPQFAAGTNGYNTCYQDNIPGTSLTIPVTPGTVYSAWVHSGTNGVVNWNANASTGSFSCTAPVPTGSLTASGCIIPAGQSSCAATLQWSTQNSYIGGNGGQLDLYATSGTPSCPWNDPNDTAANCTQSPWPAWVQNTNFWDAQSNSINVTVPYGTYNPVLYVSDSSGAWSAASNQQVAATCASGSIWNGSSCASTPSTPTGSLTVTNCTIPVGGSSCPISFQWSTQNSTIGGNGGELEAFATVGTPNCPWNDPYGTAADCQQSPKPAWVQNTNFWDAQSNTVSINAPAGTYNPRLYVADSSGTWSLASSQNATASCASGSSWNGSSCAAGSCANGLNINTYPSCTCPSGQVQSGSSCVASSCSNGLDVNTYPSCTCPSGQVQSGSSCVTPSCANGLDINTYPSCTCPAGDAVVNNTCQPVSPTITSFSVNPGRVRSGSTAKVTWSSQNATSCVVRDQSGQSIGSGLSGTATPVVTAQTTYTLTCTNSTGSVSLSSTVGLIPNTQEI